MCKNCLVNQQQLRFKQQRHGNKFQIMSLSKTPANTLAMPSKQAQSPPIRAFENTLRLLQLNHTVIHDTSVEYTSPEYPGILDTDLTVLTPKECITLKVVIGILCILSLFGNVSTLGVNVRRKMRPFFRACLISLALSDILNTIFLATAYYAQVSAEYVQIWLLGALMCDLVPFITTSAILASSLTLVAIALDRYFAILKAYVPHWKPGQTSGVICMLSIWIFSFGVSSPLYWIYEMKTVYILKEVKMNSGEPQEETSWQAEASKENISYTLVKVEKLVRMCVTNKKDVTLYYLIVFAMIFVPSIIAFVWLNATIAKNIWIRRRVQHCTENNQQALAFPTGKSMRSLKTKNTLPASTAIDSTVNSTKSTKLSTITPNNAGRSPTRYNNLSNTREARHYRMVVVIILLIAVFICMRLPAWIFLLMRMYGTYSRQQDWVLYFALGTLNMTSCALNPLFYTFLHETIAYLLCCKMRCCERRRSIKRCVGCSSSGSTDDSCDKGCLGCCGFYRGIFRKCSRSKNSTSDTHDQNDPAQSSKKPRPLSLEKDEGVDCSDASYYDDDIDVGDDDFGHNEASVSANRQERVFTVFTVSLVQVPVDLSFKDNEK